MSEEIFPGYLKTRFTRLATFIVKVSTHTSYMLRNSAPASVILEYYKTLLRRRKYLEYEETSRKFHRQILAGQFSIDWFTESVPRWMVALEVLGDKSRALKGLEIGSLEGMSALFLLSQFPQLHLTCVDTWAGSDEHFDKNIVDIRGFAEIERNFDLNMADFKDRLNKVKSTSLSFFLNCQANEEFDVIYVDGSHYSDDILLDALKGFELLKVGGLMVFDDYLWPYYMKMGDSAASAIHAFLKLKRGLFRLVFVSKQIAIVKNSQSNRLRRSVSSGRGQQNGALT